VQTRPRHWTSQLAELIDEPEQRARHLALAATRPDAEKAAAIEDSARAASARGARRLERAPTR
jgi:hypothetical protein